jgi:hypothetical protein
VKEFAVVPPELGDVLNREDTQTPREAGKVCQESISKKVGIDNEDKRL